MAKCPYDPADNSTAVWVTEGNPGGLEAVYAGTNAEFTKADPVIFRNDLFDFSTGQKKYNFKRTLKYDSKWLDSKFSKKILKTVLYNNKMIIIRKLRWTIGSG